jgi:hypothetical protein
MASMPPMSVLAAAPPPPPGTAPEPPGPPGAVPRLSLSTPQDKPAGPKGLNIRVAESHPKIGGKPVVKPGKTATVLRKRPALGVAAKAGIAVLVIAVAVGGVFSYRIFFPGPATVVPIKSPPIAKPARSGDMKQPAADILSKSAAAPGKPVDGGQNAIGSHRSEAQAKTDALASGQEPPATPAPASDTTEVVMAQSNITSDVKVNNTRIGTSPAASAEFRLFVANAGIGGVFQGSPARAFINGRIVRAGQVVDNPLGIMFDRIDADKKVIYFKDMTGAEVSKNY